MNRTIQNITDKLTDLLPENQQYYKMGDLYAWGFPIFMVERIQIELERNLAESIRLPQTDWANLQSSAVQGVWQQFINAIRNEVWLPVGHAQSVIETAVTDVLEILVQPRKNIPSVIFDDDDKLNTEQVKERINVLVVYSHFASLLPRYMEKKDLKYLTKERCSKIIKKADEKVTSRYTPLNWAQMFEPLFDLLDGQIDSSLLRLFFEDKNMSELAQKFDLMEQPVNRAKLIEILTEPKAFNMEEYEEDDSNLFEAGEPKESPGMAEEQILGLEEKPISLEDDDNSSVEEDQSEDQIHFLEDESEDIQDNINEKQVPTPLSNKSRESNIEFQHEEASLNNIFSDNFEIEDTHSDPDDFWEEQEEKGVSLNNNFEETENEKVEESEVDVAESQQEALEDDLKEEQESDIKEDSAEKKGKKGRKPKEETPMWKRFMSSDELENLAEQEEQELKYEFEESESEDEPIFDLSAYDEPDEEELSALKDRLKDERDYFIEEIFRGSERAYEEALEEITTKVDWRSASRYIEAEVFKRNLVDMYSEEAIDFTDRLHNYFTEKSDS